MKFTVKITEELVARSKCGEPDKCVLANAALELIPRISVSFYAEWGSLKPFATFNNGPVKYQPLEVYNVMEAFDNGVPVAGRSVEIEIPDEVINAAYPDHVELAKAIANAPHVEAVV